MAEILFVKTTTEKGDLLITWSGVTEGDTFQEFELEEVVSEISFHGAGTFAGTTLTCAGGNYSGAQVALQQMNGLDASMTTEDIFSILDRPQFITPNLSGGSGASVTVYMLVRR